MHLTPVIALAGLAAAAPYNFTLSSDNSPSTAGLKFRRSTPSNGTVLARDFNSNSTAPPAGIPAGIPAASPAGQPAGQPASPQAGPQAGFKFPKPSPFNETVPAGLKFRRSAPSNDTILARDFPGNATAPPAPPAGIPAGSPAGFPAGPQAGAHARPAGLNHFQGPPPSNETVPHLVTRSSNLTARNFPAGNSTAPPAGAPAGIPAGFPAGPQAGAHARPAGLDHFQGPPPSNETVPHLITRSSNLTARDFPAGNSTAPPAPPAGIPAGFPAGQPAGHFAAPHDGPKPQTPSPFNETAPHLVTRSSNLTARDFPAGNSTAPPAGIPAGVPAGQPAGQPAGLPVGHFAAPHDGPKLQRPPPFNGTVAPRDFTTNSTVPPFVPAPHPAGLKYRRSTNETDTMSVDITGLSVDEQLAGNTLNIESIASVYFLLNSNTTCQAQNPGTSGTVFNCGDAAYSFGLVNGTSTQYALRLYHTPDENTHHAGLADIETYCHAGTTSALGSYEICDQVEPTVTVTLS